MKEVYTVDDLESRNLIDKGANKPARLAVLGWPVAHSASPPMHQAALDADGIDARYIRVEVPPGRIREAIDRLRNLEFKGCNITVPHKVEAMESCDAIDPAAQSIGTINTLLFETGTTRGFNTDAPGFTKAIEQAFGKPLSSLKVAIAGAAGGAGQAIATQCVLLGISELTLINRSQDKLAHLVERLETLGKSTHIHSLGFDHPDLQDRCHSSQLIVNTTSIGLKEGDPSILPNDCLLPSHLIYDTIYKPAITPLLHLANRKGCQTANGFSMLLHQGALSYQLWFPSTDPFDHMRAALTQG